MLYHSQPKKNNGPKAMLSGLAKKKGNYFLGQTASLAALATTN